MYKPIFVLSAVVLLCVQASIPPRIKYPNGPDVPAGEHLICRYPQEYDEVKAHIDLKTQQKNGLRCDLKHYTELQRPCDFRKVNRYKLVTITVDAAYAQDDIRCYMDFKGDTLHIEDATLRDSQKKIKFNVYTVRHPKK